LRSKGWFLEDSAHERNLSSNLGRAVLIDGKEDATRLRLFQSCGVSRAKRLHEEHICVKRMGAL